MSEEKFYKDKFRGNVYCVLKIHETECEHDLNVQAISALKGNLFRPVYFSKKCFSNWDEISKEEWNKWIADNPKKT
jgi:hypothetical protein